MRDEILDGLDPETLEPFCPHWPDAFEVPAFLR